MGDKDYLVVLQAVKDLPFHVGKTLLVDFLQGNEDNPSILRNHLDLQECYGSLAYTANEIKNLINEMEREGFLDNVRMKFGPVYKLTSKGLKELSTPSYFQKNVMTKWGENEHSSDLKKLYEQFDFFLNGLSQDQKKAVVDPANNILCVAGAGSGKTAVLTKRIEFLVRFRGVNPKEMLAVTFTRKARDEMLNRLKGIDVHVETFNSFCEKILRKHSEDIYDKPVRMIGFGNKIKVVKSVLNDYNIPLEEVLDTYFSKKLLKTHGRDKLFKIFVNDCFSVLDHLKRKEMDVYDFSINTNRKDYDMSKLVYRVCDGISDFMNENGFRDFSDQLVDVKNFFMKNPDKIPFFEHVLVDEYQDVNDIQVDIINLLNSNNLFVVGDPRQSIYGWRGSNVSHILDFEKERSAEVVVLKENYRSKKNLVDVFNGVSKNLGMPSNKSFSNEHGIVRIIKCDTEEAEYEFVCQRIMSSEVNKQDIFVLARTNRQLGDLSQYLKKRNIPYVMRSEDNLQSVKDGFVTIATVHGIKGLEAKQVYVVGVNDNNFPSKKSDHPVIDLLVDDYDKYEEEKRLFYVALTRAMDSLFITYTGIESEFLSYIKLFTEKVDDKVVKKINEFKQALDFNDMKILNEPVIKELALRKPSSFSELNSVAGLSQSFIRENGKELLEVIRNSKAS